MADKPKVITGAIVKITATPKGGQPVTIGRAMSMDIAESYGVRPVYGIGSMTPQELPILQWAGQLSLGLFAIPSKTNILHQFSKQGTVTQLINNLLFGEGVDIVVARRVKAADDTTEEYVDVATVQGAVCQSENISIQEGNIVMRSGSFLMGAPLTYL